MNEKTKGTWLEKIELIQSEVIPLKQIEPNKGQIEGLPKNPRIIKDDKFRKLKKSIEENPEMTALREILVYPLDENRFVIIGGNMRYRAIKDLGYKIAICKILPKDTSLEQLKAYTIKDNAGFGEWDWDELANMWDENLLSDWGIDIPVIDEPPQVGENVKEDDFDYEGSNIKKRVSSGDVWQLGNHRLYCGDCTESISFERLMNGEKAVVCFTDPPYGMKKESDGVLNDNLNFDDLLAFNKLWIPLTFANLTDNGSWYCWGIDEPLMDIYSEILKPMIRRREICFRNLITWDKKNGQGQMSDELRMYPIADEKCLFVMVGSDAVQGFTVNAKDYSPAMEPLRSYLEQEIARLNQSDTQIANALGYKAGRTVNHWHSKSQFTLPTKENYEALRSYGISVLGDCNFLKKDYDELKKDFYASRSYFDNTHDNMNNVWHFDRTSKEERELTGGHATPKPLALCSRGIKTSSRDGDIVLDCFGGSGSTLIACEQLGRKCRMMELDPHYCDVIIARWEKLTGKKAEMIVHFETGK